MLDISLGKSFINKGKIMKKFIKLHVRGNKGDVPVFIDPQAIETIFVDNNSETTSLGVSTHNNGGWKVKETPEEIFALIAEYNQSCGKAE